MRSCLQNYWSLLTIQKVFIPPLWQTDDYKSSQKSWEFLLILILYVKVVPSSPYTTLVFGRSTCDKGKISSAQWHQVLYICIYTFVVGFLVFLVEGPLANQFQAEGCPSIIEIKMRNEMSQQQNKIILGGRGYVQCTMVLMLRALNIFTIFWECPKDFWCLL